MSAAEDTGDADPGAAQAPATAGAREDRTPTPIVPQQSIAGRALALVIAIMTFLAGLTIGAVTLVDDAATAWQSDIGREVTVEVRPLDGVSLDAEIAKAVALAQEFPGVAGARALTDEETQLVRVPPPG